MLLKELACCCRDIQGRGESQPSLKGLFGGNRGRGGRSDSLSFATPYGPLSFHTLPFYDIDSKPRCLLLLTSGLTARHGDYGIGCICLSLVQCGHWVCLVLSSLCYGRDNRFHYHSFFRISLATKPCRRWQSSHFFSLTAACMSFMARVLVCKFLVTV